MIKRRTGKLKLRDFSAYDLEWVPERPTKGKGTPLKRVRLVGIYDELRGYRHYEKIEHFFAREFTTENEGRWFYAHAGGAFDVQFILDEALKINREFKKPIFEIKATMSGGSAIIVRIRYTGKREGYTFIDSYWLLRTSLKNIGKWIGLDKLDQEKRRTREEAREYFASAPLETLIPYNRQDCEILWTAIDRFQKVLLDMGTDLQVTQASTSMNLFLRNYLRKDIYIEETSNKIAYPAYYASRVEVFKKYCDDARYYDINSSFPYAMTFPLPFERTQGGGRDSYHLSDNPDHLYIADVTVEVPEMYMPPLPYRMRERLFFPVGKWRGTYTSLDIQHLQERGGRILKVHEVWHYNRFNDLREFALDIYRMRNESEGFESEVYKIMLNSCYGKFAENPNKQSLLFAPDPMELLVEGATYELFPAQGAWKREENVEIAHRHVAVAAFIVARARINLNEHMYRSGLGTEVYYCDTDGFATEWEYKTGSKLGELKLEKLVSKGEFVQPKVYRLEGIDVKKNKPLAQEDPETGEMRPGLIKAKGFSRLTYTEFAKLKEGEAIEFERTSKIMTNLRQGTTTPHAFLMSKRFQDAAIGKRFFYPDGESRPWSINELRSGSELPKKLRFRF